jgi:circadian clock protein KaiC
MRYLSVGIVMFRFFESRGLLLKAVSVVKSRTSEHELMISEFRLGKSGIEVGQALEDFEGVMTGIASYKGSTPLLGDSLLAGQT